MSSGANKLINSDNTIKGNSQDALAGKVTGNANEKAADIKEIPCEYPAGE